MVAVEAHSPAPLIPLRFFTNGTRAVANLGALFYTSAFFTYFFLLTLFQQQVLGYSPLRGGPAYVPLGTATGAGVGLGTDYAGDAAAAAIEALKHAVAAIVT